jgi:hypothetical protein
MAKPLNVTINWSYPRLFSEYLKNPLISNYGLYYITSTFVRNKELIKLPIYVGETMRTFSKRFKEHYDDKSPFLNKTGTFEVRLGLIEKPTYLPPKYKENIKNFLIAIESGLIFELYRQGDEVTRHLVNKRQTEIYNTEYNLIVHNTGFRHFLPEVFDNREHYIE